MPDVRSRLVGCFQVVFDGLSDAQVEQATRAATESWDSVAAITLVNVVEEEFHIQIDYDRLPELDSFPRILDYLTQRLCLT
ncbi:MAG: acyl carrier protein [Pseudomonadota bacterium]|jgi:acyl carrier protein|nr:acyl carrier protein [Pseudomonadota bacterium]